MQPVSATRLFALLIALSLLFGPPAMGRAMAAGPGAGAPQIAADHHCTHKHEGKADKTAKPCCTVMSATEAALPDALGRVRPLPRIAAIAAPVAHHRGIHAEIATPPPRLA